jgi:hypothetical protein
MIRVWTFGRHAHRMPLRYPALEPLFAPRIAWVARPEEADIHVFAHVLDIAAVPEELVDDWRRRQRPLVLLSEEPFWDTIWTGRPLAHDIEVETGFGPLPVRQICHTTSTLFDFDRLPYYLLTSHRFANAYRYRFARNAARRPGDWLTLWQTAPLERTFIFERRPEARHWQHWPEANLIGLCSWRTDLAEACAGAGTERLGNSWTPGRIRQSLPDWHLDKLVRLDGRARQIGAIENTHLPHYLTEKVFDAFACGALPLYYASPRHRLHGLGLPPESWLNLYGRTPEEAAALCTEWRPRRQTAEAYCAAQQHLNRRLGDPAAWLAERRRLAAAVPDALETVLAAP